MNRESGLHLVQDPTTRQPVPGSAVRARRTLLWRAQGLQYLPGNVCKCEVYNFAAGIRDVLGRRPWQLFLNGHHELKQISIKRLFLEGQVGILLQSRDRQWLNQLRALTISQVTCQTVIPVLATYWMCPTARDWLDKLLYA